MAFFTARLRQHYRLEEVDLLVLEETYEGDIGPGDRLKVELPAGGTKKILVQDVAWGSSVSSKNPPLTLIVRGLDGAEPAPGALIDPVS